MINETLGKQNFQSLFKQVYQQTVSILSLESQAERLSLLGAVKNFEANYVYNWQRFLYPILNGPETSTFNKYTGLRSAPWAEYDVLDPERGGISGWTLTAEPWAKETGLPCLWDGTRGQPNSITGALYCLSARIDAIVLQDFDFEPYDDTELRSLIQCNDLNIQTLYKDIYACDIETNCSGNERLQFSFQRHLYEIFSQIISGGPDLSGNFSCEEAYPKLFLNISTCDISWDPTCPLVEIEAGPITNGATIKLENNGVFYDNVDVIGTGSVTVSYNSTTQQIEINGVPNTNTTYSIGTSTLNQSEVLINLTDSNGTVDSISLVAGQNISITQSNDRIEISSTDTQNVYDNSVLAITNGVELELNENGTKVDGTSIVGSGSVTVSRISDSEIEINGSNNITGAINGKTILGQKAISPIRAIDYYAELEQAECCYEYTYSTTSPGITDRVVNSGTVRSTSNPSANIFGTAPASGEYLLADATVQGGRGMSVSFWLNKPHLDWVSTNSRQVVWCAYDRTTNNIAFELYLGYPKNHQLDPEYLNATSSQGQDMNEHLVLYAASSTGFLYRLVDITEEGFHGQWKHFSITFDLDLLANSAVNLYIDGALYSNALSVQLDSATTRGIPYFDSYSLFAYPVAPWRGFGGAIEDFVIYSEQLTQAEVTSIFGQREYHNTPNTSLWVNGKVAEWWQLGEDPIFGNLAVGDSIPSALAINSRVNGQTINGINRTGTQISFSSTYTLFNLIGHVWSTASSIVAGNAQKATGSIQITQDGITGAAAGWTIKVPRVVDEFGTSNTRVEYVVFESTVDPNLDLKQDPNTYHYYLYLSTNGTQADATYSLYQAMINAGFNNDFTPVIGLNNTILQLTARDYGSRFNQPILKSDFRYVSTVGFSGGSGSATECFPALGPGRAQGSVAFRADFSTTTLAAGSKVTLISTDGTFITYRCESSAAAVFANGDLDGTSSEVIFLNGDDLSHGSPTVQTGLRFEAALDNFIAAINSSNGHNGVSTSPKFILQKNILKSAYTVNITQSLYGSAGNTPIIFVESAPNPIGTTIVAVSFTGGSDSLGGVPDNILEYSQEAFFNRWHCTSQEIELVEGKRYDIELSGYNVFKGQGAPGCQEENNDIVDTIDNFFSDLFSQVSSDIYKSFTIPRQNGPNIEGEQIVEFRSQDIAGIAIVLRNENSCTEDPRNICFVPEYDSVPDYLKKDYYVGSAAPYEQAIGSYNKNTKSGILGKNAFRSYYGKWKALISLTIGKASDGHPDKVNIYFKGEGVELDLYEYSKTIDFTGNANWYSFANEIEQGHATTLIGSGGAPKNRFDFEFKNPFRHRRYAYGDGQGMFSYSMETVALGLKSNVIENVPTARIDQSGMNAGTHYYVNGTVAGFVFNGPLSSNTAAQQAILTAVPIGTLSWFMDAQSEEGEPVLVNYTSDLGVQLEEYPGITFWVNSTFVLGAGTISDSNLSSYLTYYNTLFTQGLINYRLFPLENCVLEPINRIELITWGLDAGRFRSNLVGVLQGTWNGPKDFISPDGEIGISTYLEEFSIKEFAFESNCNFEIVNPFASFDFGFSGGLAGAGNCNYCPEWEVSTAYEFQFSDASNNPITPNSDGIYVGVVNILPVVLPTLLEGTCVYNLCSEEIIQDSYLSHSTVDGYGYLVQEQGDYETSDNGTMTTTSA